MVVQKSPCRRAGRAASSFLLRGGSENLPDDGDNFLFRFCRHDESIDVAECAILCLKIYP